MGAPRTMPGAASVIGAIRAPTPMSPPVGVARAGLGPADDLLGGQLFDGVGARCEEQDEDGEGRREEVFHANDRVCNRLADNTKDSERKKSAVHATPALPPTGQTGHAPFAVGSPISHVRKMASSGTYVGQVLSKRPNYDSMR